MQEVREMSEYRNMLTNYYGDGRDTSRYDRACFCSCCGARIDPRARFCNRCGKINTPSASRSAANAQSGSSQANRDYGHHNMSGDKYRGTPGKPRQESRGDYGRFVGCLSVEPQVALDYVTKRMRNSGTIWLLIGIYQLLVGVATLFVGYGVFPIAVGIWNLTNSSRQKKAAAKYAANPAGIISAYESGRTMSIVFIFLNLFLGAGFGMLGSIYDLSTCNYVLSHKDAFIKLERMARCA